MRVRTVASSRSTASASPIQPRSRALTVASKARPMLVGDVLFRVLLDVVRGEVVLLGGHERGEEGPGAAGDHPEVLELLRGRGDVGGLVVAADALGDERGDEPQSDGDLSLIHI